MERYLHGPTPGQHEEMLSEEAVESATAKLQQDLAVWGPRSVLVAPAAAVSALGELTPGGALMKCHLDESLARMQPLLSITFFSQILKFLFRLFYYHDLNMGLVGLNCLFTSSWHTIIFCLLHRFLFL